MMMEPQGLIVLLLVGLVAGWLAGKLIQGRGFGVIGDLIVGVIGAFLGNWILGTIGIFVGMGLIGEIVTATLGAVVLVLIIRLVRRA